MSITDRKEPAGWLDEIEEMGGGMPVWESIRVAWRGLTNNKMRTGLTMLGIIIGVAAVIIMVSMGQGASLMVAQRIKSLGTNLLTVVSGNPNLRIGQGVVSKLTVSDANAIQSSFPSTIRAVAPQARGPVMVKMGNQEANTTIIGTAPSYVQVNNAPVQYGRFFNAADVLGRMKVAVVGTTVISNLLGNPNANPIGRTIQINRVPYRIIGVQAPKGIGPFGGDLDDVVIIPVSTALLTVLNRRFVNFIGVECWSPQVMDLATQQISHLLEQRHHLLPPFPEDDDFRIFNQSSLLQMSQGVTGTLTALLAGVAVVSLIVGGIGIMNIMLVSVTERTREIGLRKAMGATNGDILIQFLIESLVMALAGGLIGVGFGMSGSIFLASKMGWQAVFQPTILIVAVAVSGGVGMIFGIYPAAKAARQNPIEALRYE